MTTDKEVRWTCGAQIPARYIYDGKVWFAEPMTVVSDTPERLLTYLQAGAEVQWSDYDQQTHGFVGPTPRHWHTNNILKLYEPDTWCAIWCMWRASDWDFRCWYIDFQAPLRRAGSGLVLKDLSLDIVVAPDLTWRWKDEDHFAARQAAGFIRPEEASAVRAEAKRIIGRIESHSAPFNEPWPQWRPEGAWPVPRLPDDWSEPL